MVAKFESHKLRSANTKNPLTGLQLSRKSGESNTYFTSFLLSKNFCSCFILFNGIFQFDLENRFSTTKMKLITGDLLIIFGSISVLGHEVN